MKINTRRMLDRYAALRLKQRSPREEAELLRLEARLNKKMRHWFSRDTHRQPTELERDITYLKEVARQRQKEEDAAA